ncbi:MAG: ABC transporter substrate-binding protein [Coleofasciculus sp. Co-bin14]|nr:ABC transporter substrate-binding protein [Coleofasciculus sp. Co-bin14]
MFPPVPTPHSLFRIFNWLSVSCWLLLSICLLLLGGCQLQRHVDDVGVVRLTLWQGVNPPTNRDVLQELVDRFNREHPNIQVESLYVGQEDQQLPKILASVVGNAPPDMLWFNPTLTGQLVELNAIRPLDDFLAASPVKDEIDPALLETMQFQGHIWSVPFGTNNAGIFYRPSLFKAAGISQLPKTWEELRQVAKALTRDADGDGRIDQYGMLLPLGKGEWTVFMWLPFLWSGGGELIPVISHDVNLVNESAIAALQFWRDLIEDNSAVLSLPERGYEMNGFIAGKVAMQFSGPWTLGELKRTGVEFSVFPMPSEARQATVIGGENLFLFKTTPERERAAFTFAEYVMGEEFQTQWAIETGYLPVNLKARQSEAYQAFVERQPTVEVFLKQAEYGRSRPIFRGYSRISESLGRAIEAVLLGKSSPKDALEKAQQRLNLIFQP